MKLMILALLALSLYSCSDDSQTNTVEKAVDKVEETVDDVQQEACEAIDGKVECAAERVQEDVEEAVDDM